MPNKPSVKKAHRVVHMDYMLLAKYEQDASDKGICTNDALLAVLTKYAEGIELRPEYKAWADDCVNRAIERRTNKKNY